ncbi:2OG-Fe dioxygenase family protein [Amycolatopsis sp. NPDC049868]|uniref:2OG-Fe dioxygenase family protein n=1 Tax=Amycolatopsis sp. NPDC049868 TaxID=3363934 RepID=UPI003789B571
MLNELEAVDIKGDLREQGYSLVRAEDLPLDPAVRRHEATLAAEWENLGADNYLKNGGRFRERRYGRFCYIPAEHSIRLLAHRPYFQSEMANSYAGGIQRVVDPVTETSVKNPLMNALIEFNYAQFPAKDEHADDAWEVACHQFRIIARPDELGEPTPEGIHRDEIDFGAIHLMSRTNVTGGLSKIYDNEREQIAEFALESRMDTMFWADRDVLHAVTPIKPADTSRSAVRDILILGYRRVPELRDEL